MFHAVSVCVGTDAGALALKGPATRVVDAGGLAMIPGLQDAHGHILGLGEQLAELDFRGTASFAQIAAKVT